MNYAFLAPPAALRTPAAPVCCHSICVSLGQRPRQRILDGLREFKIIFIPPDFLICHSVVLTNIQFSRCLSPFYPSFLRRVPLLYFPPPTPPGGIFCINCRSCSFSCLSFAASSCFLIFPSASRSSASDKQWSLAIS